MLGLLCEKNAVGVSAPDRDGNCSKTHAEMGASWQEKSTKAVISEQKEVKAIREQPHKKKVKAGDLFKH